MTAFEPRSKSRWRRARLVLVAVAAGALAGAGVLAWRLALTEAQVEGRVVTAGLGRAVEVVRDAHGIPHIYAQDDAGAYFGLGFVHAQDRAFQVELSQRVASGTLSELVGEDALVSDRLFRALGLRELARAQIARLDADTRSALDAYSAGYNAALDDGAHAPELVAFSRAPSRMSPERVVLALKLVAWQLSGNMLRELENYRLSRKFSFEQMAQLAPAAPGDDERAWPTAALDLAWLDDVAKHMLESTPSSADNATGSNAWAVTGARSRTGKPLLANDPHLGLSAPSVWYLAHLHAPGLNVIGATLPGTAGVWLGRNDRVAWGITNTGSDTQDLYLERRTEPLRERTEEIRVRGGATQTFVARASRHGPIVSDADPAVQKALQDHGAQHVLALAWTGLAPDDRSVQFPIKAAKAADAAQLLAAARDLRSPQQNLLYADAAGAVGFQAIGRLPVRAPNNAALGRLPVPGWDATYDWRDEVSFDAMPAHGPDDRGRVLNANDKITAPGYPHWITSEWELPYRAERIAQLLEARSQHTVRDFARMQLDVQSPLARELLPELLSQLEAARSPEDAAVMARLRAWDGSMGPERPEALVFHAWLERSSEWLYPRAYYDIRPVADPRVLRSMLRGQGDVAQFCGPKRERDCTRHVRAAFADTLATLRARYGEDLDGWRWGSHNVAWFSHALFSGLPGASRVFELMLPRGGSAHTIDLSGTYYDADTAQYVTAVGPGLRAIYDLAEPEKSLFIVAPGQSGNPLSPRYRDLAPRWNRGEYLPMITDRAAVERGRHHTLVLTPDPRS